MADKYQVDFEVGYILFIYAQIIIYTYLFYVKHVITLEYY